MKRPKSGSRLWFWFWHTIQHSFAARNLPFPVAIQMRKCFVRIINELSNELMNELSGYDSKCALGLLWVGRGPTKCWNVGQGFPQLIISLYFSNYFYYYNCCCLLFVVCHAMNNNHLKKHYKCKKIISVILNECRNWNKHISNKYII